MKKSLLILFVAFVVVSLVVSFSLIGCAAPAAETTAAAEETTAAAEETTAAAVEREGPFTVAWMPKGLGHPFFDSCFKGASEAAAEFGDEIFEVGPDDWSVEGQIAIIESLIDQGVDGMAIAANGAEPLAPVCKKAIDAGIVVTSWDSNILPEANMIHVNQVSFENAGRTQIQMAAELCDFEGEIAILSTTPQTPNQMKWVDWMYEELKKPEYEKMTVVDLVFGDDLPEKSYEKALGLVKAYPDLKVIVAPTAVGGPAAAAVVTDEGLAGEVFVTGLMLPSSMIDYVKSGVSPMFGLWNTEDLGYLGYYGCALMLRGQLTNQGIGETFTTGRPTDTGQTEFTTVEGQDGGAEIVVGPLKIFDESNIDEWGAKI